MATLEEIKTRMAREVTIPVELLDMDLCLVTPSHARAAEVNKKHIQFLKMAERDKKNERIEELMALKRELSALAISTCLKVEDGLSANQDFCLDLLLNVGGPDSHLVAVCFRMCGVLGFDDTPNDPEEFEKIRKRNLELSRKGIEAPDNDPKDEDFLSK